MKDVAVQILFMVVGLWMYIRLKVFLYDLGVVITTIARGRDIKAPKPDEPVLDLTLLDDNPPQMSWGGARQADTSLISQKPGG